MDGLGDTFDGLFSNRSKENMLEIMRDSRVGTNAVIAIASVILLYFTLLIEIKQEYLAVVLVLMPVAGRIGSLIGAGVSTYARSGEGLGKSFIEYCGIKEIIAGIVIYEAAFFIVLGLSGLVISVFPLLFSYLTVKFFSSKIGGATGDILGAVCELNQIFFLITVYVFVQLTGGILL